MSNLLQLSVARASVAALNHLLGQHAWARDLLAKHQGKHLALTSNLPTLPLFGAPPTLRASIGEDGYFSGVQASDKASDKKADVEIAMELSPTSFSKPLQSSAKVSGDAELAMVLGQLLGEMRWDAAEDLHHVFGPSAAQLIVDSATQVGQSVQTLAKQTAQSTRDLAVDTLLVESGEIKGFQANLRELRDRLDRLDARLTQVEKIRVQ